MQMFDRQTWWMLGIALAVLFTASLIGQFLKRVVKTDTARATVRNLNDRINAWWVMVFVLCAAIAAGTIGSVILFGMLSFLALREFITLTPTKRADHMALFWVFFLITPLQYYLVAVQWYGLFSIMIPVYAFLFIPIRNAIAADTGDFLARTAKIQWALMICTYCVSHVPALLMLNIPGYEGQNVKLLLFLILVVEMSDVLQYVWGKTLGRRKIAPELSPSKTVAGFVGGILSATLLGAALWKVTPFTPLQAAGLSFLITLLGFGGGLVMSAIKRDRGVKDYGNMIAGHGGIMDRIDSLSFAAPVFFHFVRFFFTP